MDMEFGATGDRRRGGEQPIGDRTGHGQEDSANIGMSWGRSGPDILDGDSSGGSKDRGSRENGGTRADRREAIETDHDGLPSDRDVG